MHKTADVRDIGLGFQVLIAGMKRSFGKIQLEHFFQFGLPM